MYTILNKSVLECMGQNFLNSKYMYSKSWRLLSSVIQMSAVSWAYNWVPLVFPIIIPSFLLKRTYHMI